MYLENSEQGKISGEVDLSTKDILAEQCAVPKVAEPAGLSNLSRQSTDLDIRILVEYTEQSVSGDMDPPLCVECDKLNTDETELYTHCNGHTESFKEYPASDGFTESDDDTAGLRQLFDECTLHCECFKLCESSEHCANHSIASTSSLCCERCSEHLLLFPQCKPSDQDSESVDFETDDSEVNCDSLGQTEMSDFMPEGTDHLELLQQYEPSDQDCNSDFERDGSTEDWEQSFTPNISDSIDSLDCAAGLCECAESQMQTEYTDDEDECYEAAQNEVALNDEESSTLSEDMTNFTNTPFKNDIGEEEETSEQTSVTDVSTDVGELCGEDDSEYEPTQQNNCENSEEFSTEEDGSSESSSVDTKSFKSCLDDSFPSDSSEEYDKGAQEDLSDEQIQWESLKENEEEKHKSNRSNDEQQKTTAANAVLQDHFDLFDKAESYGHKFAEKRHYISCFDGGDIHDHLHPEEEVQKCSVETEYELQDMNEEICAHEYIVQSEEAYEIKMHENGVHSEDAAEDADEENASLKEESSDSENQSDDWTMISEASSTKDEADENESETLSSYPENSEETEDDEISVDGDTSVFDGYISDIHDEEEHEDCLCSGHEESMFAPCAKEISVEGDAYEDKVSASENHNSLVDAPPTDVTEISADLREDEKEKPAPENNDFLSCLEMEPYWGLVDHEKSGEFCESCAEDYYAYGIKSIQLSGKQDLHGFILNRSSNNQRDEDADEDASSESPAIQDCPEESKSAGFGITVVEKMEQTNNENELNESSTELNPPLDIIHSVVSKHANEATQSRDSDEEQSDDESIDHCECEYCIPPTQQVSAKPLLSQVTSSDPEKICVVIDLDETLVHSSFKPLNNADFIIPVEIEGTMHQVYVLKRPHVDEFLKRMGELFECVLFTASLSKYADPVSDLLDKCGAFQSRLFREACVFHKGNYVKDLSRLGRDLNKVIIIDNSPASYIFHPDNAVPVVSWFDDMSDTELLDLIPFFERISKVEDIHDILKEQRTSSLQDV